MGKKGIPWVKWEEVCKEKENGGLGIRDLGRVNKALLAKWRWRLLVEASGIWRKVLVGKYGEAARNLDDCARIKGSRWWRDLEKIWGRQLGSQGWFYKQVVRRIGDGKETRFWKDNWLGEGPLSERFQRLYSLTTRKDAKVVEMGHWVDGRWVWGWRWRRPLFVWETQMLSDMEISLSNVQVRAGQADSWQWSTNHTGTYSTKDAINLLNTENLGQGDFYKHFWCNMVPLKVQGFAWKLTKGRIQTVDQLMKRNIRGLNLQQCCPLCGLQAENADHLIFSCSVSYRIWMNFYNWWGVKGALQQHCKAHFDQHRGNMGKNRKLKEVWKAGWFATVWSIWLARNEKAFNNKDPDINRVGERIKIRLWTWCKAKLSSFQGPIPQWCVDPISCC